MSSYKLTYFNFRGRGEIVRLVFAAAGVAYEDNRVEFEQWPELKPSTPFAQLPILEVDGVTLCQSNSIARLIARRFGLAGKTDLDQARADMIIDCYEDVVTPGLAAAWFEKDPTRQEELKKKYFEQLPVYLDNLEKLLTENKGGDGYFVGDDLTWADLGISFLFDVVRLTGAGDLLDKRPKLFALRQRVETHPRIAEWIAKRPKSDY